jgi:hypothetical protein
MATKKAVTAEPELYEAQPGQVVVIATRRVEVADQALNQGWMENYFYGVEAEVPTILPERMWSVPDSDAVRLERDGILTRTDKTRGVLPPAVNGHDSYWAATWRDGQRPRPNRAERINHFRNVLIDQSLSECCVLILDSTDYDESFVLEFLMNSYERAYQRADGSATARVWAEDTRRLIEEWRAEHLDRRET